MSGPVLIIGSAPVSEELSALPLKRFQKVAINKSWRLRDDYAHHVFLRSMPETEMPPEKTKMQRIGQTKFRGALNAAGGLYLCSGSVAMIAGYWAISHLTPKVVAYHGCDLDFTPDQKGRTHYYGEGDAGPLFGNFNYNLRQTERSIRLFCWGLLHNAIVVNATGQNGSVLAFPKMPLKETGNAIQARVRTLPMTETLIRNAAEIFAFEIAKRPEAFNQKQKLFEKNAAALEMLDHIMDRWQGMAPQIAEFCDAFEQSA